LELFVPDVEFNVLVWDGLTDVNETEGLVNVVIDQVALLVPITTVAVKTEE
jgi:serine/threonine protein phosphatase PrpC